MKIFSIVLLFWSSMFFSQIRAIKTQQFLENLDNMIKLNKELSIEGSPYVNDLFQLAELGVNNQIKLKIRYNSYTDEIEYENNNEIYNINKNIDYSPYIINETGEKIVLINYSHNNINYFGYLFEIFSNNQLKVYKKIKTIFLKEEKARNSYSDSLPDRYKMLNPEFLILDQNNNAITLPQSKKKIIELFPKDKIEIEKYFKENKVSFNNDISVKNLMFIINK